jgi:hypothetical protein
MFVTLILPKREGSYYWYITPQSSQILLLDWLSTCLSYTPLSEVIDEQKKCLCLSSMSVLGDFPILILHERQITNSVAEYIQNEHKDKSVHKQ